MPLGESKNPYIISVIPGVFNVLASVRDLGMGLRENKIICREKSEKRKKRNKNTTINRCYSNISEFGLHGSHKKKCAYFQVKITAF